MLKNHQFYYLLAKLANKGQIDWEHDRDFTESERAAIRQGINDLAFYSPYKADPVGRTDGNSPYQSQGAVETNTVAAGTERKSSGKAGRN